MFKKNPLESVSIFVPAAFSRLSMYLSEDSCLFNDAIGEKFANLKEFLVFIHVCACALQSLT